MAAMFLQCFERKHTQYSSSFHFSNVSFSHKISFWCCGVPHQVIDPILWTVPYDVITSFFFLKEV